MIELQNYYLKSSSFYDGLESREKKLLMSKSTRMEFKKGEHLFKEGSYPKGIYIVRKGKIKIFKTNQDGLHSIVYIYRKGDYFGYRPLLAEYPQPITASAMDNVVISFIPKDVFMTLFNRSELLAKRIAVILSKEFTVWINKMTVFTQYSVKERVALSLLILNRVYQNDDDSKVTISISRDDFASFVGTAKESLVRTLRIFKDAGIITSQGAKIVVKKPDLLYDYFS